MYDLFVAIYITSYMYIEYFYIMYITHTAFSPTFMHPSATWKTNKQTPAATTAPPCFTVKNTPCRVSMGKARVVCAQSLQLRPKFDALQKPLSGLEAPLSGSDRFLWRLMDGPFAPEKAFGTSKTMWTYKKYTDAVTIYWVEIYSEYDVGLWVNS